MRFLLRASFIAFLGCCATVTSAQVPISLTVSGNEARGSIDLPGGLRAQLTLTFEDVVGLTPAALDVVASVVDPLDPDLIGRLPSSQGELPGGILRQVTIPAAFPVLVAIEPSAASALSLSGVVHVQLYTHNLNLTPLIPLALFKAAAGGPFQDITTWEGTGSYRVCGSGGDFSEFLIVVDTRPINTVITGKFDALQATLDAASGAMPAAVAAALQQQLTEALALFQAEATVAAIDAVSRFSQLVKDHSGSEIPDVWRAHDPGVVNHAGRLRAASDTLRFSLARKTSR